VNEARVFLLGAPRVIRAGQPAGTDRRKALALLAYLACNPRPQPRESLAALLWPEHPADKAMAYLRRTLWEINQLLGPDGLTADRQTVELGHELWVDVREFDRLMSAGLAPSPDRLAAAVALWQGPFLAGFSLKDAPEFDTWCSTESERLMRQMASALRALVAHHQGGEPDLAARFAQRWVELEPLEEPAHQALIEALARAGQSGAALRVYDQWVARLRAELEVSPEPRTERLVERVRAGEFADSRPPARVLTAASLPVWPTALIGRDADLEAVFTRLADPECRLLTLLGPGGVGKTRLAIEAARRVADRYAQGMAAAWLAPVDDPTRVPAAIAAAYDFHFFGNADDAQADVRQLVAFLRDKHTLLVLDNCEHLLEAGPMLAELLARAPRLTVLATSRERLNLSAEFVFPVTGLSTRLEGGAVALFLRAARRLAPEYGRQDEDREAVRRICELLGGFPLALELAAAWAQMLDPQALAEELGSNLDLLTTDRRDVELRHRSLRAVFESTWARLSAPAQQVFARLSVLRDPFTREAAQFIASADLATLTRLVDQSLLASHGAGRFSVHELLRQFGLAKLAAHGLAHAAEQRHSRFFGRFMREQGQALYRHSQRQALDRIAQRFDDIRLGFTWAVAHDQPEAVDDYVDGVCEYLDMRSRFREGQALSDAVRIAWEARADSAPAAVLVQARLLAWNANFQMRMARLPEAVQLARRALDLFDSLGPLGEDARARLGLNLIMHVTPAELDEVVDRIKFSLDFFQTHNDRRGLALLKPFLPYAADPRSTPEFESLRRAREEGIAELLAVGDVRSAAMHMGYLGEALHHYGLFADARRVFDEAIRCSAELGDRYSLSLALDWSGWVARQMGDYAAAREMHQRSLAISRDLGDVLGVAGSIDNLGLIDLDQGDLAAARGQFEAAMRLRREVDHPWSLSVSLVHMADLELQSGRLAPAEAYVRENMGLNADSYLTRWIMAEVDVALGHFDEAAVHVKAGLERARRDHDRWVALLIKTTEARLAAMRGALREAVSAIAFVLEQPGADVVTRRRARALEAEVRARLPREAFDAAWAAGQALTWPTPTVPAPST
jgi:predicted ATPase/DNA-binding SARP family transcriptional activator